MTHTESRYAIYIAPPPESDLHAFGASWTGRDAYTNKPVEELRLQGFSEAEIKNATAFPRHYGFHGTLKAPFRLADGYTKDHLIEGTRSFAGRRAPFFIPPLTLAPIRDFVALQPATICLELNRLAEACVRELDVFRAQPPEEEIERRKAAGLTRRQTEYLKKWGYPYVMEDFQFHITLTGSLEDPQERERFMLALAILVRPFTRHPQPVDALALFHQENLSSPFRIIESFPFGRLL
ncbi:MAG: DUF1045 domain-containing protein [Desulfobacteraceae bacterium]|jgi:putative phosphonate metabolism protein|nr:MAG: DUF1045 domain-containing protein [Desulfobacteraceae bacterium]